MARKSAYVDLKKTIVRDSQGRRITDKYIRKSLKESEEDIKQFYAGRPSLSEEGVTSPRVSVRLPVKLHKLAKQKAKQKGLSLSDLTRLALEKYLRAS
jgi:predicted HicB family RNase H-like nuclease